MNLYVSCIYNCVTENIFKCSVPAAVISLGYVYITPWKTDVKLPCMAVGKPSPAVEWKLGDMKIKKFPR